jgi:hypothetical protein
MRRIAGVMEKSGIPYAIVGGMAVKSHGYRRTTDDVDFLVTAEGFARFRAIASSEEIESVPGRPRRFLDSINGITFDLLVTGRFPGSGDPGPVAYPDPSSVSQVIENVTVIDLKTLVQLKLAATRHQDFADVVNLIRFNNLDESFQDQLHPSVRKDYIECLEEKRREDEYERRQDQGMDDLSNDPPSGGDSTK